MTKLHRDSLFASSQLAYGVTVSTPEGGRRVNLHHPTFGKQFWQGIAQAYSMYDERNVITITVRQFKTNSSEWPKMSEFATPNFSADYSPDYYLQMVRLYPLRDVILDELARPSTLSFFGTVELMMCDKPLEYDVSHTASIARHIRLHLRTGYFDILET